MASDQLHLGVGVDGDHVVALGGLHAGHGVRLAVQALLDEEVAPLLQVQAAVVAHEAVGMVQLIPGLYHGAPGVQRGGRVMVMVLKGQRGVMVSQDYLDEWYNAGVPKWGYAYH